MTPEDMAALHARCFTEAPRPWSAEEFRTLGAQAGTATLTTQTGFLVARITPPKAEILTLAIDPAHRRQGIAIRLFDDLSATARNAGCDEILLEVSETNVAARALYRHIGFAQVGHRKDYYHSARGPKVSAIVLRYRLKPEN